MIPRLLIILNISVCLITTLSGQVNVQIMNPILQPGESTQVVVEVKNPGEECKLNVYGVHTAGIVQFSDTIIALPSYQGADNPVFIISLPVQALPEVIAIWGEYLIVAEIQGNVVTPEIIALSPGHPCSGNVGVGHPQNQMTFSWNARGAFSQFEIIVCENPCGQVPPTTTTTPPSIPTVTTTPSYPSTPTLTPSIPPGWSIGPNGYEWNGYGAPSTANPIGTSGPIPCNISMSPEFINYSFTMDVSSFLQPGNAFAYQVYGMTVATDGNSTGALSQTMCDRYSPMIPGTDIPVTTTECPKLGCTLTYEWKKKTPIDVVKPIAAYPNGDDLKEMIPGSCISFSVLANDFDLLKQECEGKAACEERVKTIKKIGPIENGVLYTWTKTGDGELKEVCQNTIFYKTPTTFKKGDKKTAIITVVLSNVGGKAPDDPITGTIEITMTFIDSCKCISTELVINQPLEAKYDDDFDEVKGSVCIPKPPDWIKAADIGGSLTVQKELCPGALTILKSSYADADEVKLICDAQSCGLDEEKLPLEDPLTYTWSDEGAGGSFPLGSTGPCVLYKAPTEPKKITFKFEVKDSGTQFPDKKDPVKENNDVKKLLDLTEMNVTEKGIYSNITVGHGHKITPVWMPKDAKVKKVVWEFDLGGPKGKVRKVLCNPDGLTPETATLRFTVGSKEENLDVSWKLHTHIHAVKDLKCKIYGTAGSCQDCCLCEDDKWDKSDFLGRDKLAITQFKLFFDKEQFEDDGKIEDLKKVRDYDEWGEKTKLHDDDAANWFTHWSKTTYATCQHDHQATDPKVKFKKSEQWRGIYEPDKIMISLAPGASEKDIRKAWKGEIFIESSDLKWIDTKLKSQPAYDFKGHVMANKVFFHESGHFTSMTKNWRNGEVWQAVYGDRTTEDASKSKIPVGTNKHVDVAATIVGNYGKPKAEGVDVVQKYNMVITTYKGDGKNKAADKVINLTNAWIVSSKPISWAGKTGTFTSEFEVKTINQRYVFNANVLEEFERANDPDGDYVPNIEEDKVGTSWKQVQTHPNHARGSMTTSTGLRQTPDQEFWADQYMFDNLKDVTPGKPKLDWANPGAQSDPEYK